MDGWMVFGEVVDAGGGKVGGKKEEHNKEKKWQSRGIPQ